MSDPTSTGGDTNSSSTTSSTTTTTTTTSSSAHGNKPQRELWTADEHERFLEALSLYNRDWRSIELHVGTKTVVQIRSHAQKHFIKMHKMGLGNEVPTPKVRGKVQAKKSSYQRDKPVATRSNNHPHAQPGSTTPIPSTTSSTGSSPIHTHSMNDSEENMNASSDDSKKMIQMVYNNFNDGLNTTINTQLNPQGPFTSLASPNHTTLSITHPSGLPPPPGSLTQQLLTTSPAQLNHIQKNILGGLALGSNHGANSNPIIGPNNTRSQQQSLPLPVAQHAGSHYQLSAHGNVFALQHDTAGGIVPNPLGGFQMTQLLPPGDNNQPKDGMNTSSTNNSTNPHRGGVQLTANVGAAGNGPLLSIFPQSSLKPLSNTGPAQLPGFPVAKLPHPASPMNSRIASTALGGSVLNTPVVQPLSQLVSRPQSPIPRRISSGSPLLLAKQPPQEAYVLQTSLLNAARKQQGGSVPNMNIVPSLAHQQMTLLPNSQQGTPHFSARNPAQPTSMIFPLSPTARLGAAAPIFPTNQSPHHLHKQQNQHHNQSSNQDESATVSTTPTKSSMVHVLGTDPQHQSQSQQQQQQQSDPQTTSNLSTTMNNPVSSIGFTQALASLSFKLGAYSANSLISNPANTNTTTALLDDKPTHTPALGQPLHTVPPLHSVPPSVTHHAVSTTPKNEIEAKKQEDGSMSLYRMSRPPLVQTTSHNPLHDVLRRYPGDDSNTTMTPLAVEGTPLSSMTHLASPNPLSSSASASQSFSINNSDKANIDSIPFPAVKMLSMPMGEIDYNRDRLSSLIKSQQYQQLTQIPTDARHSSSPANALSSATSLLSSAIAPLPVVGVNRIAAGSAKASISTQNIHTSKGDFDSVDDLADDQIDLLFGLNSVLPADILKSAKAAFEASEAAGKAAIGQTDGSGTTDPTTAHNNNTNATKFQPPPLPKPSTAPTVTPLGQLATLLPTTQQRDIVNTSALMPYTDNMNTNQSDPLSAANTIPGNTTGPDFLSIMNPKFIAAGSVNDKSPYTMSQNSYLPYLSSQFGKAQTSLTAHIPTASTITIPSRLQPSLQTVMVTGGLPTFDPLILAAAHLQQNADVTGPPGAGLFANIDDNLTINPVPDTLSSSAGPIEFETISAQRRRQLLLQDAQFQLGLKKNIGAVKQRAVMLQAKNTSNGEYDRFFDRMTQAPYHVHTKQFQLAMLDLIDQSQTSKSSQEGGQGFESTTMMGDSSTSSVTAPNALAPAARTSFNITNPMTMDQLHIAPLPNYPELDQAVYPQIIALFDHPGLLLDDFDRSEFFGADLETQMMNKDPSIGVIPTIPYPFGAEISAPTHLKPPHERGLTMGDLLPSHSNDSRPFDVTKLRALVSNKGDLNTDDSDPVFAVDKVMDFADKVDDYGLFGLDVVLGLDLDDETITENNINNNSIILHNSTTDANPTTTPVYDESILTAMTTSPQSMLDFIQQFTFESGEIRVDARKHSLEWLDDIGDLEDDFDQFESYLDEQKYPNEYHDDITTGFDADSDDADNNDAGLDQITKAFMAKSEGNRELITRFISDSKLLSFADITNDNNIANDSDIDAHTTDIDFYKEQARLAQGREIGEKGTFVAGSEDQFNAQINDAMVKLRHGLENKAWEQPNFGLKSQSQQQPFAQADFQELIQLIDNFDLSTSDPSPKSTPVGTVSAQHHTLMDNSDLAPHTIAVPHPFDPSKPPQSFPVDPVAVELEEQIKASKGSESIAKLLTDDDYVFPQRVRPQTPGGTVVTSGVNLIDTELTDPTMPRRKHNYDKTLQSVGYLNSLSEVDHDGHNVNDDTKNGQCCDDDDEDLDIFKQHMLEKRYREEVAQFSGRHGAVIKVDHYEPHEVVHGTSMAQLIAMTPDEHFRMYQNAELWLATYSEHRHRANKKLYLKNLQSTQRRNRKAQYRRDALQEGLPLDGLELNEEGDENINDNEAHINAFGELVDPETQLPLKPARFIAKQMIYDAVELYVTVMIDVLNEFGALFNAQQERLHLEKLGIVHNQPHPHQPWRQQTSIAGLINFPSPQQVAARIETITALKRAVLVFLFSLFDPTTSSVHEVNDLSPELTTVATAEEIMAQSALEDQLEQQKSHIVIDLPSNQLSKIPPGPSTIVLPSAAIEKSRLNHTKKKSNARLLSSKSVQGQNQPMILPKSSQNSQNLTPQERIRLFNALPRDCQLIISLVLHNICRNVFQIDLLMHIHTTHATAVGTGAGYNKVAIELHAKRFDETVDAEIANLCQQQLLPQPLSAPPSAGRPGDRYLSVRELLDYFNVMRQQDVLVKVQANGVREQMLVLKAFVENTPLPSAPNQNDLELLHQYGAIASSVQYPIVTGLNNVGSLLTQYLPVRIKAVYLDSLLTMIELIYVQLYQQIVEHPPGWTKGDLNREVISLLSNLLFKFLISLHPTTYTTSGSGLNGDPSTAANHVVQNPPEPNSSIAANAMSGTTSLSHNAQSQMGPLLSLNQQRLLIEDTTLMLKAIIDFFQHYAYPTNFIDQLKAIDAYCADLNNRVAVPQVSIQVPVEITPESTTAVIDPTTGAQTFQVVPAHHEMVETQQTSIRCWTLPPWLRNQSTTPPITPPTIPTVSHKPTQSSRMSCKPLLR